MKLTTFVQDEQQLLDCHQQNIKDIILEPIDLARFGKLSIDQFNDLSTKAKELGMNVSLQWDVLMTENEFAHKTKVLSQLKSYTDIRVQDIGALNYAIDNLDCAISPILETGNHNLKAIETWILAIGNRLNRVILSIELPKDILKHYCESLACPVEFLILGRILLFYTPRNLLSALTDEVDETRKKLMTSSDFLAATGESEESPHKGFPLVENRHGTFMFHIKRLCLADKLNELESMKISYGRLDYRFDDQFCPKEIQKVMTNKLSANEFKEQYSYDVIKGYYLINKTDVLFKKLKNYRIQRKDDSYIGEVIEASKGNYLAITIKKHDINLGDQLLFITPEGKELQCEVHFLKNSQMQDIATSSKDELCLINYFGGVWVKSQVYLKK